MAIVEFEGLPVDSYSVDHDAAIAVGDAPASPWQTPSDPWVNRPSNPVAADDDDDADDEEEGGESDDDWDGEGVMPIPGAPIAPEEIDDFDENDFDDDFDDDFEEELEDEYDMAELEEDVTPDELVADDDEDIPDLEDEDDEKPKRKKEEED